MNAIPGDCGSEQSGQPSGARGTAEVASGPEGGNPGRIYVEDWTAAFGTPYMIADDAERAETSEVAEDGGSFTFHAGHPSEPGDLQLAFVDGVRRGDVSLYQEDSDSGAIARGVAATHACGAVLCEEGSRPVIADVRVTRLVIWGSGVTGELPPVAGGWSWKSESVATTAPDAPVRTLQTRMRQNEARLTEDLAQAGWHVVLDGPLHFVRYHHLPVCGYVKTHARPYLPAELHRQVRPLRGGERTSLFVLRGKDPGTRATYDSRTRQGTQGRGTGSSGWNSQSRRASRLSPLKQPAWPVCSPCTPAFRIPTLGPPRTSNPSGRSSESFGTGLETHDSRSERFVPPSPPSAFHPSHREPR